MQRLCLADQPQGKERCCNGRHTHDQTQQPSLEACVLCALLVVVAPLLASIEELFGRSLSSLIDEQLS